MGCRKRRQEVAWKSTVGPDIPSGGTKYRRTGREKYRRTGQADTGERTVGPDSRQAARKYRRTVLTHRPFSRTDRFSRTGSHVYPRTGSPDRFSGTTVPDIDRHRHPRKKYRRTGQRTEGTGHPGGKVPSDRAGNVPSDRTAGLSADAGQSSLDVGDQVIRTFDASGESDVRLRNAGLSACFRSHRRVAHGLRMLDQRLHAAK